MGNMRTTEMSGGKVQKRQWTQTVWRCTICKTDYNRLGSAERCARMPVEPRVFKRGDRVTWRTLAVCDHGQNRMKGFHINATVTRVGKPEPPDEEYNLKWLVGALTGKHVRQYEVAFRCLCRKKRSMLLYAAELKKLP